MEQARRRGTNGGHSDYVDICGAICYLQKSYRHRKKKKKKLIIKYFYSGKKNCINLEKCQINPMSSR